MPPARSRSTITPADILATLTPWLEQDPDVQALWLGGSLGRDGGDAYSDIDLYVAVQADRFVNFYQSVPARVQTLIPLAHTVEFTFRRESPTERVWFLYPAAASIHQRIDFHVHTMDSAQGADPDQRRELVGQEWTVIKDPHHLLAPLPAVAGPEPEAYREHLQERTDYLAMVFALLATYVARGQFWPAVGYLASLQERVLAYAAAVQDPGSVGDGYPRRLARAAEPALVAQLADIRFGESQQSQAAAALALIAAFEQAAGTASSTASGTASVRYPAAFMARVQAEYRGLLSHR